MKIDEVKREIENKDPDVLKKARQVLEEKEIDKILEEIKSDDIQDAILKIKSTTAETAIMLGNIEYQKRKAETADDIEDIINNRFL